MTATTIGADLASFTRWARASDPDLWDAFARLYIDACIAERYEALCAESAGLRWRPEVLFAVETGFTLPRLEPHLEVS